MEHKIKEPKARLTKRSTSQEIKECLQHAVWHCRYGSQGDKREYTDYEASNLIERYMKDI